VGHQSADWSSYTSTKRSAAENKARGVADCWTEACGLQLKFSEGFSRQGGFQQVWDNPHAPHAATYIYVPVEGTAKHTSGECNVFSGG